MTDPDDRTLDASLARLPAPDVGAWRREHVRQEAHAALEEARTRPSLYHRVLEPALVAAVCLAHLAWATWRVASMLGG